MKSRNNNCFPPNRIYPPTIKVLGSSTKRGSEGPPGPPGPSVIGIISENLYYRQAEEGVDITPVDPLLPGVGTTIPLTDETGNSVLSSLNVSGTVDLLPGRHVIDISALFESPGNSTDFEQLSLGISSSEQLGQVIPGSISTISIDSITGIVQQFYLTSYFLFEITNPITIGIVACTRDGIPLNVVGSNQLQNPFLSEGFFSAKMRIISYPLVPV